MCSKRCPGSNLRTLQAGCRKVVFPRISPLPTGSDLRRPGSYAWTFASAKAPADPQGPKPPSPEPQSWSKLKKSCRLLRRACKILK